MFLLFFRMESIWQENSIGIDVIPSHQALEMIDEQVATVLRELWEHNESITIAGELYIVIYFQSKHIFFLGGFVTYCLGLTNQYGDIDIFCHPVSCTEFSFRMQQHGYETRPQHVTASDGYPYPEQFTLYRLYDPNGFWTGCQIIQVCAPWLQFVAPLEGPLFARTVIRDFDLQLCRAAIYKDSYIQR